MCRTLCRSTLIARRGSISFDTLAGWAVWGGASMPLQHIYVAAQHSESVPWLAQGTNACDVVECLAWAYNPLQQITAALGIQRCRWAWWLWQL